MAQGDFYQTDFTKQILFLGDGSYLDDARDRSAPAGQHLGNDERDGQLPRPGLAVAVLVLVPDPAVQLDNPTTT